MVVDDGRREGVGAGLGAAVGVTEGAGGVAGSGAGAAESAGGVAGSGAEVGDGLIVTQLARISKKQIANMVKVPSLFISKIIVVLSKRIVNNHWACGMWLRQLRGMWCWRNVRILLNRNLVEFYLSSL